MNLIGEHVDYSGFSVLPMCIDQDVLVMYGSSSLAADGNCRVENFDHSFAGFTFPSSFPPSTINPAVFAWTNYFLAGYGSFLEHTRITPRPLYFLVHGTVPKGAGLSSSSALVCAAILATMAAHGLSIPRTELADLACNAERHVGTMGGGMDQAISLLGSKGTAKLIHFFPLRTEDVPLPDGALFVIMHSRVDSLKAAAGRPFEDTYNMRVVECRLAAAALARHLALPVRAPGATPRRLAEVMHEANQTLADMESLCAKVLPPEPLTPATVASLLGISLAELAQQYLSRVPPHVSHYHLLRRARHVYSESARVLAFRVECMRAAHASQLHVLGALMNASHASLATDFACSAPELDRLVSHACAAGALGARLTGAGWGGCVVALVPTPIISSFLSAIRQQFYADIASDTQLSELLFVTAPGAGASLATFDT